MIMRLFFMLTALLCCAAGVQARDAGRIERETFLFAVKGSDSLCLDKYDDPSVGGSKPCVIFLFGGGFWTGARNAEGYVSFFRFLVRQGYVVVAPDYRLRMKEVKRMRGLSAEAFSRLFARAQDTATEDLFDATRYVLDSAAQWGIDPGTIVVCGSSAGAITALNGEYRLCDPEATDARRLPDGFDYAGVIAFAGAILSEGADLSWGRKPCPALLFHGDSDQAVPCGRVEIGPVGYYGSKVLAAQWRRMGAPYCLYLAGNRDHEMAGVPMNELRPVILDFLQRYVREKKPLMIETTETSTDRPERKKDYTWKDYVTTCFGPVLEEAAIR